MSSATHNSSWKEYLNSTFASLIGNTTLVFEALELYYNALELTRKKFNLIGSKEHIDDHIIDSLAPLHIFIDKIREIATTSSQIPSWLDLGTGAGLPGIPLAIVLASISQNNKIGIPNQCYLLERSHKKISFLQEVVTSLRTYLNNNPVYVIQSNLKEWSYPPHIDIVTCRAFRPMQEIWKDIKKISPKTTMLLYKGKLSTIQEEFDPLQSHIQVDKIHPLTHFKEKERHLVEAHWK